MIIFHKLQAGHVQDKHPEKFTKVWTQTKKKQLLGFTTIILVEYGIHIIIYIYVCIL